MSIDKCRITLNQVELAQRCIQDAIGSGGWLEDDTMGRLCDLYDDVRNVQRHIERELRKIETQQKGRG